MTRNPILIHDAITSVDRKQLDTKRPTATAAVSSYKIVELKPTSLSTFRFWCPGPQ